jgi:Mn2+/Fe2+ NRAMP family transporter
MPAKSNKQSRHKKNFVRRFFSLLGLGLISGAADDDPSGIATYLIAGARLGTAQLWTAFVTWPFMGCVQFMCAHIGMVTGKGLASALRQKFPRWVLVLACVGLLVANTINVGAGSAAYAFAETFRWHQGIDRVTVGAITLAIFVAAIAMFIL